jgi:hypothetical protein
MPWRDKEKQYHQQIRKWKNIIGQNYVSEGDEDNIWRKIIFSMEYQDEMVLTVLMAQDKKEITLSSESGKISGTRDCAKLDMKTF